MNDPHVTTLKYRIVEADTIEFNNPPDVDIDTPDFRGHLSKGVLTLEPKQHFESEAQVRPLADEFIQGWEVAAGLKYGRSDFRFRFEGSQIEDRDPAPGERSLHLSEHMYASGTLQAKRIYNTYPVSPEKFQITPEVELFWNRYCHYVEGRELLLAMAYSCLSYLEKDKGRQAAGQHYAIEFDVLDKLGDLTANRGDNTTARKFKTPITPLSSNEQTWIESTIKAIIQHLATRKPGQILQMTDLPSLT